MFTQFFGNFLLNEKLVTADQLVYGLQEKANTRLKLGLLAMNAGYMTSGQVERVHEMQTRMDKRFGDIAVELGYMTENQVSELLEAQQSGYLLLGQALVDKGYLTNFDFEKALIKYKAKYYLTDEDMALTNEVKMKEMISSFIDVSSENQDLYTDYIELLIKNLVRFVGDDFSIGEPLSEIPANELLYKVTQMVDGDFSSNTAMYASKAVILEFASRFIQENLTTIDEYTEAGSCDFLNLHNGLFTVNTSNNKEIELRLAPPVFSKGVAGNGNKKVLVLPVFYTFGTITFVLTL